jgi:hypothetical protein
MSRSLSRLQAVVLGAAVLSGITVVMAALFAVGSRQWLWSDTLHLQVGFRQLHGVEVGTRVRVLGTEAGEVEAVGLPEDPSGQVVLRLRIDGGLRRLIRADAVAQIVAVGMVGGQAVEIDPGSDQAACVCENAVIASKPSADLSDLLAKIDSSLHRLSQGQGSLGKLLKEDEAYQELLQLVRQGRGTLVSLKQDADAIKGLPVVRSYVQDPIRVLVRPDCERSRQSFAETALFEPGRAVLHDEGRSHLDELVPWLNGSKVKGSEIVVAAYADPAMDLSLAQNITQKQSEAICNYLTGAHKVQKLGWFSRRKVIPLGCGIQPCPIPEDHDLPVPRIDILVFVPQ